MNKAISLLQKAQITLAGIFLFIFMATVVIQMFARYLAIQATWTQEIAGYSFIWALFMGSSAMVYEKRHFAFTSISDMLNNQRIKTLLAILISSIMLIFSLLMVYYGAKLTQNFWNYKWITIPDFIRGPTWLCLPVSGATSSIYLLSHIVADAKTFAKGGNT